MEGGMERGRAIEEGMNRILYKAAMAGDVALLDELHNNKTDILFESTPKRNTALHIAASYGHLDFVKRFIQICKVRIEACSGIFRAQNREGNTALHEACSGGSDDVVRVLLEEDEQLACVKNYKDETPVFKAAEKGHYKIVYSLLPKTPSDCLRRGDGQTPLHVAVRNSKEVVVCVLLGEMPDLAKEVDMSGRTALHIASFAAFSRWERIWKFRVNDISAILICRNKSACYTADNNGDTPLHIAVREGNADLTEEILKYEPSCIEMVDREGRSALHLAVEQATRIYGRSARDLKRIMASVTGPTLVNCTDKSGQTALATAMKKGAEDPQLYTAIRDYLLRRGASPQERESSCSPSAHVKAKKDASIAEPITINVSLIATVAFSVAFTLPKVGHSFSNQFLFYLLVICDTMAFCYSLGVALLLIYVRGNPDFSISAYIFAAISVAGASLAVTFGAAIHLAVAPNYTGLPIIVWVMVVSMIYTGITRSHGKLFLFGENWKHVLIILVYPVTDLLTLVFLKIPYSVLKHAYNILHSCYDAYKVSMLVREKLRAFTTKY